MQSACCEWGREWPAIAGLIARMADRPSETEIWKILRAHRTEILAKSRRTRLIPRIAVVTPSRRLRYLRGSPARTRIKERLAHDVFPFDRRSPCSDCVLFAGAVHAQGAPSKGEQTLKYRKSLYQVLAYNFGPMGAMAQGKVPYDAAEFTRSGRNALR